MQTPDWYRRDVSRETLEKLDAYAALLRKWTVKINLVSKASENDLEHRHIWDSAQIYEAQQADWLDFGSGGGLPGVVVGVLASGEGHDLSLKLVESDQRKATFLRTCARELEVPLEVLTQRVESLPIHAASTISARALASLDALLGLAAPHLAEGGTCVFMKGEAWAQELEAAQQNWRFSCDATPSKTNEKAAILRIKDIERA